MRAVVQRVREASVTVDGAVVGAIGAGLLVLLGVGEEDTEADADYLVEKCIALRIFNDTDGKFNLSLEETGGAVLVVSQFTLSGDVRNGRRPSFITAAAPELARALYEDVVRELQAGGLTVATGEFQAMMQVSLINDGPVTILLDSRKLF